MLGLTLSAVSLIGYSAMVGAVGGGGLGDLGIRYGYQRFMPEVMAAVVIILIALVQAVQSIGDTLARHLDPPHPPRMIVLREGKQPMRKLVLSAALATLLATPALAETIKVGVTIGPHAQIMEKVVPEAKKLGLDLKVIEFSDYVIPNQALAQGDIDLNSFQHGPYLQNQIAKTNWKQVAVGNTILTPMGFYSKKYKSFAEIPVGATIAHSE